MEVRSSSAISAATNEMKVQAPAVGEVVDFEGMVFAVTEGNEVAEVLDGGAVRVLGSESFFDWTTGTQEHFVDVSWKN
ncbi:hypothetical protein EJB05_47929, partial [Eragrostis curvula]